RTSRSCSCRTRQLGCKERASHWPLRSDGLSATARRTRLKSPHRPFPQSDEEEALLLRAAGAGGDPARSPRVRRQGRKARGRPGASVRLDRHACPVRCRAGHAAVQSDPRALRNLATTRVPITVAVTLTAFRPRSFETPLARGSILTGTSSTRRPAWLSRRRASTSGASVRNGSASTGSAFALTA